MPHDDDLSAFASHLYNAEVADLVDLILRSSDNPQQAQAFCALLVRCRNPQDSSETQNTVRSALRQAFLYTHLFSAAFDAFLETVLPPPPKPAKDPEEDNDNDDDGNELLTDVPPFNQ